jgi:GMP synthase-like glutamine amidotransferase
MRALAFRHVAFEGAGLLEPALRGRGVSIDYVDAFEHGAAIPSPLDCEALIFLGGPMSVNDDLPYLRREMEIIRAAVAGGKPVLGICLGAQLIAKALGGRVFANLHKEIGWFDVRFTPDAARDPVFGGLSAETVFHWHGETFDLPPGAELLASSDLCRNQAFRIKPNVYGLQFHLEVTPGMVADWCVQDENCGDVRELHIAIDPAAHASRLATLSDLVFGRWWDSLEEGRGVTRAANCPTIG